MAESEETSTVTKVLLILTAIFICFIISTVFLGDLFYIFDLWYTSVYLMFYKYPSIKYTYYGEVHRRSCRTGCRPRICDHYVNDHHRYYGAIITHPSFKNYKFRMMRLSSSRKRPAVKAVLSIVFKYRYVWMMVSIEEALRHASSKSS